ncbi:MAG: glycosyltransferase [Herpetosiphonaceae bacterium]|nr:glycosyltransferase [Herpetosiphonaceae bacterium]
MPKFLIGVWPFPGHYFPLIAVARALRERGHEVAFYTGAQARALIEAEGFVCFPFEHIDEDSLAALMVAREEFASTRRPGKLRTLLREWLLGTLPGQVTDLTKVINRWQPDVIVAETALWGPGLVLHETLHIPVAIFSTVAACMLPGVDVPLFGLGLPRPHNLQTRWLTRGVTVVGNLVAAGFRRQANKLRHGYGLAPLAVPPTEYFGHMPLYLMPSLPEFDYQRQDLPSSVHYIGPCVWNKPQTEVTPDWLRELPHDQPWVHVSEGTVNSQQPLVLRAAAQGLANQPMHVIMTTGGNRAPETLDLGPIAPNVRLVRWVSHSDLLPQTDVLVTTGGAGTIMTALQCGVPMVVIPTEWDKPDNARRVVAAGVGVRLSPHQCTAERLRAAVLEVLQNPIYRRNARHMQTLLEQYDGPHRAAELLEMLGIGQLAQEAA